MIDLDTVPRPDGHKPSIRCAASGSATEKP